MKEVLKLVWKTTKKVLYPFLKRKAKSVLKGYLWSLALQLGIFSGLVAAVVAFILIYL